MGRRIAAYGAALMVALLIAAPPLRAIDLGAGPGAAARRRGHLRLRDARRHRHRQCRSDARRAASAGGRAALLPGHRPDGGGGQRGPGRPERRHVVRRSRRADGRPQGRRRRAAARAAGRQLAARRRGRSPDRWRAHGIRARRVFALPALSEFRCAAAVADHGAQGDPRSGDATTSRIAMPFSSCAGVPIFYTPYFTHPDPTVKRRSGFLAPSFGNDSSLGLSVQPIYYFALAPNYDVTLVADLLQSRRIRSSPASTDICWRAGASNSTAAAPTPANRSSRKATRSRRGNTFRGAIKGEGRFRLPQQLGERLRSGGGLRRHLP